MEYVIDYLPDLDIVKIRVEGRINFHKVELYSKSAVKLARQNNCLRFLIDHSNTVLNKDSKQMHLSGDELQQFGFKNTDRIAIILRNPDEKFRFLSFPNGNIGWSELKIFSENDYEDSLQWLVHN